MHVLPDEYVQHLFDELENGSIDYAQAKAEAFGFSEDRKITKAHLMAVAAADDVKSIAKQELFAYNHPTYSALVAKQKRAIEEEARLLYKLKILELQFEAWRTINANARVRG